jgi:hypothetical protein
LIGLGVTKDLLGEIVLGVWIIINKVINDYCNINKFEV